MCCPFCVCVVKPLLPKNCMKFDQIEHFIDCFTRNTRNCDDCNFSHIKMMKCAHKISNVYAQNVKL